MICIGILTSSLRTFLDVPIIFIAAFQDLSETGEGEIAAGKVDGDEPGGDEINEMVEQVGVCDTVSSGIEREEEEEDVGHVADTCSNRQYVDVSECQKATSTYLEVTLGIIFPQVRVSTRRIKGIIDKTLWWEENGVSQWTAKLCTQTTKTGRLMGRTQSMRMRIECT